MFVVGSWSRFKIVMMGCCNKAKSHWPTDWSLNTRNHWMGGWAGERLCRNGEKGEAADRAGEGFVAQSVQQGASHGIIIINKLSAIYWMTKHRRVSNSRKTIQHICTYTFTHINTIKHNHLSEIVLSFQLHVINFRILVFGVKENSNRALNKFGYTYVLKLCAPFSLNSSFFNRIFKFRFAYMIAVPFIWVIGLNVSDPNESAPLFIVQDLEDTQSLVQVCELTSQFRQVH